MAEKLTEEQKKALAKQEAKEEFQKQLDFSIRRPQDKAHRKLTPEELVAKVSDASKHILDL